MMFRVPSDGLSPVFDHTFRVSFRRWATSGKADRVEWFRRRKVARRLAQRNQEARIRGRR
jgi:hypothetical protein